MTEHLLVLTVAAARNALTRLPLTDADRPLVIGRYAEHALDQLGNPTRPGSALDELASFPPSAAPTTPNEALEAALRHWADAARAELDRHIPSTGVLANIASGDIHLYAVADQLTAAAADLGRIPTQAAEQARAQFRWTAASFEITAKLWQAVTTAQRPTHAYVSAAAELNTTLLEITHDGATPRRPDDLAARIDLAQALVDLRYAGTDLLELMNTARPLPAVLARSQLLFAPAQTLRTTPERLPDITHRRFIAADPNDIPALTTATRNAADAARRGRAALAATAGPQTGHEPQNQLLRRPTYGPPAPTARRRRLRDTESAVPTAPSLEL